MSVQLIKGEKILKSYEYATSHSKGLAATNGSKTLVITNKRIIHRESLSGGKGTGLNVSEMPISSAKFINTSLKVARYPILLVWGIIFALAALSLLLLGSDMDLPVIVPLVSLAIAIVFFIVYALKKTYMFSCYIDTDTLVNNAFGFSSIAGDSLTVGLWSKAGKANKSFYIKVKVVPGVVEEMAEELGSVIAAAANGDYDE